MRLIRSQSCRRLVSGALITEAVIAMALIVVTLFPLAYIFAAESKLFRAYVHRAVAMEIVDGEMEVLAAGEWRAFGPGQHDYPVRAQAVTNLPPGNFVLTRSPDRLRLEWSPKGRGVSGSVTREVKLP